MKNITGTSVWFFNKILCVLLEEKVASWDVREAGLLMVKIQPRKSRNKRIYCEYDHDGTHSLKSDVFKHIRIQNKLDEKIR